MRIKVTAIITMMFAVIASHAVAQDEERVRGAEVFPQTTPSLFLGAVTETERGVKVATSLGIGVEVEYRFKKQWGVSGVVEFTVDTGNNVVRDALVLAVAEWHFWKNLGLVLGPGIEFGDSEHSAVLRIGANWESPFIEPFKVIPEFLVDFVEGGGISYVYGVGLARTF